MHKKQTALIIIGIGLVMLSFAAALAIYKPASVEETASSASSQESDRACSPPANVSFPVPELELTSIDGRVVDLDQFSGQVIVLNTWATWCPPCRAEMPDLQALHETYQDQGLALVGINIGESAEEVQEFAQAYHLSFNLWLDPHEESLQAFHTISLPSTFVIDRSGLVRYIWSGMTCFEQLESNVAPLLSDL